MKKIVTAFLLSLILTNNLFSIDKQKTGLVLSGGGLKGFGHLGTLHIIDSLNIPIDFIAGTSIGAISAALYATGHSAYEIDKIGSDTKWKEVFGQSRKRSDLYFFQKKDNAKFQLNFSLRGFRPVSPISVSNGQYSYEHLLNIFGNYINVNNYDDLLIPFRCNATDIINGEEIIFNSGSIPKALRVSTSIPTIFSPIEYNNQLLVDGGLINNLPVNLVENLGAEYIISSNVMSSNKSKDEIVDIFNMVFKIIDLYGNENEQINLLKSDILVSPNLDNISIIDYDIKNINKMKLRGKKAAYSQIDKFLKLNNNNNSLINLASIPEDTIKIDSVILSEAMTDDLIINNLFQNNSLLSKNEITNNLLEIRRSQKFYNIYSKYQKNISNQSYNLYLYGNKHKPIFINEIELIGNKKISKKELSEMLSLKNNQELNTKLLNENIKKIYNTELFEYINYDIINIDGNNSKLILNIKESNNKKLKLGAIWDNHYKLIGKLKLDIFNKPLRKFRLQNELLFSGIKRNKLTLYYSINNKSNLIPFVEFTNQIKNIGIHHNANNQINYFKHDFKQTSIGIISPISKFGFTSISYNQYKSFYDFNGSSWENIGVLNQPLAHYTKVELNIDQIDDLLHPKDGYKINLIYQTSNANYISFINEQTSIDINYITSGYQYLYYDWEYYKTYNYNHTLRIFNYNKNNFEEDISHQLPIYLQSHYGGYNWAIGYNEYTLSSNRINLIGLEYQYHFKSSVTYRFILNYIEKNDKQQSNGYGIGIKIKSFIGPINFTWGRGYSEPFNKNSKKINIFYFNFGVIL